MITSAPQVSANTEKQKESKMREIPSSADGSEMACVFLMNYTDFKETYFITPTTGSGILLTIYVHFSVPGTARSWCAHTW